MPLYGGVLATGGDVVFYGTMDGWFSAVDARNGESAVAVQDRLRHRRQPDDLSSVPTASSTSRSTPASAAGWARSRSRDFDDDPYAALGVVGAMKQIKKYTSPGDALYVFGL